MPSFRPILDQLRRTALRGLSVPRLFAHYREARDEVAVAELVRRMTPRLRARCRPYLQDRDEVDEAVQEVFRLLVERATTIRDANGVQSWLEQTAANVARNRSRRQAGMTPLPPEALDTTDPAPGPDLMAELHEKYALVLAEIDRLNDDWKRALTLRLLEERPYAEVAAILGASLDKVKQDVSRARKQLRARLARKGLVVLAAIVGMVLGGGRLAGMSRPINGRRLTPRRSISLPERASGMTAKRMRPPGGPLQRPVAIRLEPCLFSELECLEDRLVLAATNRLDSPAVTRPGPTGSRKPPPSPSPRKATLMQPLFSFLRQVVFPSSRSNPGRTPGRTSTVRPMVEELGPRIVPRAGGIHVENPIWTSDGRVTEERVIRDANGRYVGTQGNGRCGSRSDHVHAGTDLVAAEGTPVHPAVDGKVFFVRRNWKPGNKAKAGNVVVLEHRRADGSVYYTKYFHLSTIPHWVQEGKQVTKRQVIGHVGRTGNVVPGGDTHLHFEVRNVRGKIICMDIAPGRHSQPPTQSEPIYVPPVIVRTHQLNGVCDDGTFGVLAVGVTDADLPRVLAELQARGCRVIG